MGGYEPSRTQTPLSSSSVQIKNIFAWVWFEFVKSKLRLARVWLKFIVWIYDADSWFQFMTHWQNDVILSNNG